MEFVDGPDLRDFFRDASQPFDVTLALAITRGITEGLGAAHARGMVHRDIKPRNILMARDEHSWVPKIADFGIVATKEISIAYTMTGSTFLTMNYAAPEQWRGMRAADLDGRTDLYALGGVLFEMLTGQTVFWAENYEGWSREHLNTVPQPPTRLRPELANWTGLDSLVLRLLAKDREDRPRDVAELLRLLDAVQFLPPVVRQQTVEEQPKVQPKTVVEQFKVQPPPPISSQPKPAAGGFPKWAWGALVALVLVAVIVAVWIQFSPKQSRPALQSTIDRPASEVRILQGHAGWVESVAFSSDGHTLASGSVDRTIKLWDWRSGQLLQTLRDGNCVQSVAFSPDGRTLASGSQIWGSEGNEKTIKLWDVASGQILRTLRGPKYVDSVAFSPDGRTLASGAIGDHTIKLWDVASGRILHTLFGDIGYEKAVRSLAFSPDGRTLASSGSDDMIKFWDVASGQMLRTLEAGPRSVAFSPDGRTVASGSYKTTTLWDVASGQVLRTLDYSASSIAFRPDGRILALARGFDRTIKLWDVNSGEVLQTLQSHNSLILSVAFSPDGHTVASGGQDKNVVVLWDVSGLLK